MSANRKGVRHRLVLPAMMSGTDGQPLGECRTWDWSDQGARLEVAAPLDLPATFTLILSGEERRKCEIIWRSDHYVGVTFQAD